MLPAILSPRKINKLLLQNEWGVALIEFALIFPVLLLMCYGAIEVTRALLVVQQVDKTIILANNIVTQYLAPDDNSGNKPALSKTELDNMMLWVPSMMASTSPSFKTNGIIIISDVTTGANPKKPVINWQYCGGGKLTQKSKVGKGSVVGTTPARLPAGFTMSANEEVIIGEIYYQYVPLLPSIIPVNIAPFYQTSVFVPRFESLSSFVSANCS